MLPGKGLARDEGLRAYYRNLIEARRENRALSAGTFKRLSSDGDLLVFERSDATAGNAVVVAINRGKTEVTSVVDAPQAWGASGEASDVLSGVKLAVNAGRIAVNVPPRAARVYIKKT